KGAQGVVIVVQGQANLLEVVRAAHPRGGLADLLDGRQQQADQDADDGDDHQQLDQRKAAANRWNLHDESPCRDDEEIDGTPLCGIVGWSVSSIGRWPLPATNSEEEHGQRLCEELAPRAERGRYRSVRGPGFPECSHGLSPRSPSLGWSVKAIAVTRVVENVRGWGVRGDEAGWSGQRTKRPG